MRETTGKEEMRCEKRKMKKLLWNWGQAMERFRWKEEELEDLKKFHSMRRKVWEGIGTEDAMQEWKRTEKEFDEEVKRLRIEMVEILREKAWVDAVIKKLAADEELFVQMRFEKRYGFDYIGVKMHLSRATLFRMQNRILEKMILCKREERN